MSSQKELAWSMRGILLDWLVQVHAPFRLLPEAFSCVNIIDRSLSAWVVSLAKLQLVGDTCLFIASKVGEFCPPSCPLPSLRRFLIHRVRDPPRRALRTRLELVIPKPNALPPSYQQLRRQSSNHRQVPLGVRDTRMAFIGCSSVLDGRCFVLVSSFDSR